MVGVGVVVHGSNAPAEQLLRQHAVTAAIVHHRSSGGGATSGLCLTATAKLEIRDEVVRYLRDRLGLELRVIAGGVQRTNLDFVVIRTNGGNKLDHIHQIIERDLGSGGAIVHYAAGAGTTQGSGFLRDKGLRTDHFHGALAGGGQTGRTGCLHRARPAGYRSYQRLWL